MTFHTPPLALICVLILGFFFQDVNAQRKAAAMGETIKWNPDISSQIAENETVRLLNFEGAIYDGSRNSLPYFSRLVPHPYPGMEVIVSLKNAQYEPLRTTISLDPSLISTEIQVKASRMIEKKKDLLGISFIPLRKNPNSNSIEKLVSFEFDIQPGSPFKQVAHSNRFFAPSSVLSSGTWYKIGVNADGVYKITSALLQQLGMNPSSVNPANIRLFGNGGGMIPRLNSEFRHDDLVENAIFVNDGGTTGVFDNDDYVLFYGEAPATWKYDTSDGRFHHEIHLFSDFTYYFITADYSNGNSSKRIQFQSSSGASANYTSNSFDDFKFHEQENLNFIKSGRQWYGEQFDVNLTQSFNFSFPDIDLNTPVYIKSDVIAHSFSPSSFRMNYNNQLILQQNVPSVGTSYTDDYAKENISNTTFSASGPEIEISLTYFPTTSTSVGYLNYLELNTRRNLVMNGSQMLFRDKNSIGPGNVTNFNLGGNTSQVRVWEVTDPANVKEQQFSSGTSFTLQTDSLREFIAFNGTAYLTPNIVGTVQNQNLHALGAHDMIILSSPEFNSEANRLADFHRNHNNLKVVVVNPNEVYNEFSSGARDITGIREFLKMFYDRATQPSELPRFFLLFGDGSYDNKTTSSTNTNFLPTYQSYNSISLISSYVSDDYYGFLDDAEGNWDDSFVDLIDVGIGRFPVRTADEARIVVDKVIDYSTPGTFTDATLCSSGNSSSLGDWRNNICFIGDDEDSGLHLLQSNTHAIYIEQNYPVYNLDKIFIDAYTQVATPGGQRYPGVNDAINKRIERGAFIMNYTGHGGETGWAGERILDNSMINSWTNSRKYPLFITATCEFSRYDDPTRTSSGELILLREDAGGIALMSTTRLVFAAGNAQLNGAMLTFLFNPVNGEMPRLGDIYVDTKNHNLVVSNPNSRNFALLGDPAIMLAYPKFDVATTQINGAPVVADADTLSALRKVTISGEIRTGNQKLTSFNGIIYPTVFDKEVAVSTLSNDPSSPLTTFSQQKNVLYRGKASVVNGDFTFTFIVPKDIAYQIGRGRLSYYAHNGNEDAHGYYDSVMIGGSSGSMITDNTGPDIKLFLNDEKFVFGGTTDENPKILALLNDSNGINTVGNGIGHDITAQVDGKPDQIYVLNDFYEAELDSYQEGRVVYPLAKLPEGHHTLKMKVWDIYNNSSEAYTEFIVAESSRLALNHVLNYPNPFTTRTSFFFEHNRPCNTLNVQVQIYTVSGKLIKTIDRDITCEGYRVDDLDWDGRDDFGDPIGRGVYVYRLKVRSQDGASAENVERHRSDLHRHGPR